MYSLEQAKARAFERVVQADGNNVDIYKILYSYKAIACLSKEEIDNIYDEIAVRAGLMEQTTMSYNPLVTDSKGKTREETAKEELKKARKNKSLSKKQKEKVLEHIRTFNVNDYKVDTTSKDLLDSPNKAIVKINYDSFLDSKGLTNACKAISASEELIARKRDNGTSCKNTDYIVPYGLTCTEYNNNVIDSSYQMNGMQLCNMPLSQEELDVITLRGFALAYRKAEIIELRKHYRKYHKATYKEDACYIAWSEELKAIEHKLKYDSKLYEELLQGTVIVSHTGFDREHKARITTAGDYLYLFFNQIRACETLCSMLIQAQYNKRLSWVEIYCKHGAFHDVAINRLMYDMYNRAKDMKANTPFLDVLVHTETMIDSESGAEYTTHKSYTYESLYNLYKEEHAPHQKRVTVDEDGNIVSYYAKPENSAQKSTMKVFCYATLASCESTLFDTSHQELFDSSTFTLETLYKKANKRERAFMRLYAQGYTYDEIAEMYGLKNKKAVDRAFKRMTSKYNITL